MALLVWRGCLMFFLFSPVADGMQVKKVWYDAMGCQGTSSEVYENLEECLDGGAYKWKLEAGVLYQQTFDPPTPGCPEDGTVNIEMTEIFENTCMHMFGMYSLVGGSGGASGDPVAFWNGQEMAKFWLPKETWVPLLQTSHVILWALALQGPTSDHQWFDSLLVTLPNHEFFVQVGINRTDQASTHRGDYSNLQIFIGDAFPKRSALQTHGQPQLYFGPENLNVRFGVDVIQLPNKSSPTDFVFVESPNVDLALVPSKAGLDFPDDEELQWKYRHMSVLTTNIKNHSSFQGVLPQMWGLVPMEADTASMLVPPSETQEPVLVAKKKAQDSESRQRAAICAQTEMDK